MKAYVVEKEALSHNIELLQKMANGVPIWAVLKGNGYGIGVLPLARHLAEAGIDHFCVTEVREAELLRENGFEDASILMLRSTGDPAELNRLMDLRVILTIGSWETACAINAIAAERADVVEAHLKIDTGMGRYGFLPEDMNHILGVYREQKNIAVSGVYTHFNCAFGSKKLTHQEFETFQKTVSAIREAGFETGTVHCCNSSAFLRFPEMHCDGVRLGSAILGRVPFHTKLRPVGYAEAHVEELRVLPKGHPTGYGAMWTAREDTPVAEHDIDRPRHDDPRIPPGCVAVPPEITEWCHVGVSSVFALTQAQVTHPFVVKGTGVGIVTGRTGEYLCVGTPPEAFVTLRTVGRDAEEVSTLSP